jgi:hypothetical protein
VAQSEVAAPEVANQYVNRYNAALRS